MKKQQIIITVVAIVAIGSIWLLPKAVVDNDGRNNNLESRQEETAIAGGAMEESEAPSANPHAADIPDALRNEIRTLRENFENSRNSEKSTNFAAKLAQAYASAEVYDSAAWFARQTATETGLTEDKKRAGELYYEAFAHSVDEDRAQFFGDQARRYFEEVLQAQPNDLDVKNKLAMTYVSTTNPMQGIKMLREVLAADEDNETAIFNLGLLSVQSGQYDKAAERFEKLISLRPQHLQAHYWLGVSYFELGKKKKARTQFETVKQMDGDPEIQASADNYLDRI